MRYKMQYSNLVFAVATYAFEKAINQDYGIYEHEHLLKPLHLNNTYVNHHEAPRERIVKPYIRDNDVTEEVPFIAPGKVGGASSMLSTISDLLTWAKYQLKLQKKAKITQWLSIFCLNLLCLLAVRMAAQILALMVWA
ncbi:serine hydrolase [Lactobacillus sp. R2/2]|nr:serine hydrolase [Lactobacillus sp. R2/2]